MSLDIETILCRAGRMDNYAYLLTDKATGVSAVVDPSEAEPVISRCEQLGRKPSYILNTHHHYDHTDANLEIKNFFHARVVGAEYDANRIPGLDETVKDGDIWMLGNTKAEIIRVDGHTRGHILWYFPDDKALFTGDTLFNLCIGGLFEGTAKEMFVSLNKIKNSRTIPCFIRDTNIPCTVWLSPFIMTRTIRSCADMSPKLRSASAEDFRPVPYQSASKNTAIPISKLKLWTNWNNCSANKK